MMYDERFDVRNEEVERTLREIGSDIGDKMPDGFGFGLFIFSYGERGTMFYISSAQRDGVIKAVEEWIAREKKKKP